MKKNITVFAGLFFCLFVGLSSCNKKLKEDMDSLERELAANKAQVEALQNQANDQSNMLTAQSPIIVNITNATRGVDDVAFTANLDYKFESDRPFESTYFRENGNGTYDIYIERYTTGED